MAVTEQQGEFEPTPSVVTIANVVYALHTLAIVIGVIGSVSIIGSFLGSIPSIAAVIINYIKRPEAQGTRVESHFRWQIRTFWFAAAWAVVGWLAVFTIVGAVAGIPILVGLTFWLIYRIAKGWLRLRERRPMYV